jgi:uncharacterized RDD family membrane protein YckC
MQCPRCGLINPETAARCDCQFEFSTGLVAVGAPGAIGLPLAPLGDRFAGQCIDSLFGYGGMFLGTHIGVSLGVGPLPAMVMFALYLLFADGMGEGQSFGKKVMNIAVVDQKTGEPCSYRSSLLRNAVRLFGVLDWGFIFGRQRQRLGDKAAGTLVVKLRR